MVKPVIFSLTMYPLQDEVARPGQETRRRFWVTFARLYVPGIAHNTLLQVLIGVCALNLVLQAEIATAMRLVGANTLSDLNPSRVSDFFDFLFSSCHLCFHCIFKGCLEFMQSCFTQTSLAQHTSVRKAKSLCCYSETRAMLLDGSCYRFELA